MNLRVACLVVLCPAISPWVLVGAEPDSAGASPASPEARMLAGPWVPENTHAIDFDALPRLPHEHVVVSSVRAPGSNPRELDHKHGGVNQHNYLANHGGRFWIMWSDGPGIEDRGGQRVKYATSPDGLAWSEPRYITPEPRGIGPDSPHYARRTREGFRYIARGFWIREGELLALASLDEAAGYFGESLELQAFRWNEARQTWDEAGTIAKNAINNFPPQKLRTGEWMMSRRPFDYRSTGVSFLVGGVEAIDRWESFPVFGTASQFKAEEPLWWALDDGRLVGVFRDNAGSGYLYRAISTDDGRTWSAPEMTNFPDATSKLSGTRLKDGRYVLVSNPRPKKRDPLTLAVSNDGLTFDRMYYLVGGRWIDYPHVIEHGDHIFVAFAGGKQSVEVLKIKADDLQR